MVANMREIGSEFWDVPSKDNENKNFPEGIQWFLSGRSALQSIITELGGCHTVAMPSWCCDSIIKPFLDAGFYVHFYPVYWRNELIQEINLDSDVLFLMDYFGYTSVHQELSNYKGIVIRDVTHSFFSTTYSDAHYYFGSLRKWCGVWTGGYAWSNDGHKLKIEGLDDLGYIALRDIAMQQKAEYIGGKRTDKDYLKIYEQAEGVLEGVGIVPAAERDVKLAQQLDIEFIRNRRRANARVLRSAFSDWLIFTQMKNNDCPMFVPILVPDGKRDALRRYLIHIEIYCPIHWPVSNYHRLDEQVAHIYTNELSLVCDQRYTEKDMYQMIEVIKKFMEE